MDPRYRIHPRTGRIELRLLPQAGTTTFSTSPLHSDRPEVHTEDPLRQFFGAYFHQDWDCDASSQPGVVDLYLRATHPDEARRLAEAIRAYSASFADDAELEHRLSNDLG